MHQYLLLTSLLLLFAIPAKAQTETEYINAINQYFGGQREATVPNGRVDILTDQYAIEVERAAKWKNAIGQALWYALQTTKQPGIVLILEDRSEFPYLQMLQSTIDYAGLTGKITVWAYPYDFEHQKSIRPPNQDPLRATPLQTPTEKSTAQGAHWLTTSSRKRHNRSCRYFQNSAGRLCGAGEGVACKVCGG